MDGYVSVRTLASYAGLSVRTLRSYLVHPSMPLPHYRIGGKILVRPMEFDSWMLKFKVDEPSPVNAISRGESEVPAAERDGQPATPDPQADEMDKLVAAAVRGIRAGSGQTRE